MKKKKIVSLLMAALMIGQFLPSETMTAFAGESALVGKEQLADRHTVAPKKDSVVPNANQYEYQKQELAAFCHFGPNTFNEIEWGEKYGDKKPDEIFKLEEDFDADTFVEAIKEAGFEKLIVTAKHHDGFCIWNSKHTEYDVESTSYASKNYNGLGGDVLAEISAACTKYDVDMGLYLSPWDIHDDSYGYKDKDGKALVRLVNGKSEPIEGLTWADVKERDAKDYNEYYNNQLEEILGNQKYGNNGHFKEVWMDGAKGSGAGYQEYEFQKWFATIQKHEGKEAGFDSDCMLFGAEAYTTVRWIGNELGYANEETWSKSKVNYDNNTIDSKKVGAYTVGYEDGNQWTVPESDARITSGWFWGTTKNTPKSVEDLAGMYFNSVGHNSPLLLNIPPNTQGKIDEAILQRVKEFGQNIKETFKSNLAAHGTAKATEVRGNDVAYSPENVLDGKDDTYWTVNDNTTTGQLVVDLGGTKSFDVVSIEEAIQFGQRIKQFKVEYSNEGSDWKVFDQGTTIGAKRLCREGVVKADKIRITVTTSKEVPMISEVGVYKATSDFESPSAAPEGMQVIDERDEAFTFSNGWTKEDGSQYLNGTNVWAKKGASFEMIFKGSKVYLIGTLDSGHGKATVTVDGKAVEINTNASKRAVGQIIFTSDDLEDGEHTLKLEVTNNDNKAIGIEGAYVINNGGLGMVGIEKAEYTMKEDSEMKMKLVRVGGSKGEATVTVAPNPGTAIQDDFDTEGTATVTFADGEKEKDVVVITRRNTKDTGDQYFTEELSTKNEGLILGFTSKAKITILDQERQPEDVTAEKLPKDVYKTVTATSEEKTAEHKQGIENAFDENLDTFWHAQWGDAGKLKNHPNGISVEMTLKEAKEIAKLTYIPKAGDTGTVGNYIIEAATGTDDAGKTVWKEVCSGTFKNQGNSTAAQDAVFKEVIKTDKIRLTAKTMAGGEHPTAREIALYEKAEPIMITVTTKAGENGMITPVTGKLDENGTMKVQAGKLKTFAIKANAGYSIKDVLVNGKSVGAVSRYTVESDTDVTIEAVFKACEHEKTEIQGAKEPTCTEDGATGKVVCLQCGVTVKESTVIPALGHKFGQWEVVKEATDKEEGLERRACVACGFEEERTVAKLPTAVDKSKLQKYYDECIGYYKQEGYTKESWTVYEGALKNAKAMLDKESATQEEVDAAIHQLADAADKLVEKTSVTQKPENNNTSGGNNSNTSSGNKPVTGDSATPIVLLAAVLASVFAVIRQMKKKIR